MPARDDIGKLAGISIKRTNGKVVIGEQIPGLTSSGSSGAAHSVNPEEVLLRVKRYYEGLWDRVRRQAEETGFNEGFEKGYAEGYKKGIEEGRQRIREILSSVEEKVSLLDGMLSGLEQLRLSVDRKLASRFEEIESELLEELPGLVAEITKTLLDAKIATDKELLASFIEKAFRSVRSAKRVEIRVPNEMLESVKSVVSELRDTLRDIKDISVVPGDGIVIDTDVGVVDLRLEKISERIEGLLTSALLAEDGQSKANN